LHAPAPLHAPDHPAKSELASGAGVNETIVPWAKEAVHVLPQSIPAGALVTVPEPAPWRETVSRNVGVLGGITVTPFEHVTWSVPLLTWTVGT